MKLRLSNNTWGSSRIKTSIWSKHEHREKELNNNNKKNIYRNQEKGKPSACKFIVFARAGKNNETNFSITENREFFSLFNKSLSSLGESHLSTCWIINPSYHNLPSTHLQLGFLQLIYSTTPPWTNLKIIIKQETQLEIKARNKQGWDLLINYFWTRNRW